MAQIDVTCPSCCAVKGIHRNGHSRLGHQRTLSLPVLPPFVHLCRL
ncbi:IS1 family transposase [Xenorhabdus thailandensis]